MIPYDQPPPLFGGFSESELVEKPAIELFAELGWTTGNLFGEFAQGQSAEGRASRREAILPNRLRSALERLNPALPQTALDEAYAELTRDRRAIDPIRANAEVHALIRNGVPVEVRGAGGERKTETARVVAWDEPDANDFFLASQVWFAGELYTRRADLVGFVSGLPLLFVELKASARRWPTPMTTISPTIARRSRRSSRRTPSSSFPTASTPCSGRPMRRSNFSTSGSGSTTRRRPAPSASTR
jgi:type I restriction enzyme, R subunit